MKMYYLIYVYVKLFINEVLVSGDGVEIRLTITLKSYQNKVSNNF